MRTSSRFQLQLTLASVALCFSACTSVHATYVPDGRRGFAITCGGLLDSWSSCLVKAGRACGNLGYENIKGNEDDRAMLIACKLSAASPVVDPSRH
jgi:hypothetical protein